MKMRWTLRLILVVLVVQAVGLMSAQATDYRWDKATDGNWNDTSAWTPTGSFPNNGNDTARVGTTTPGVTVFANDDFMVSQITLVEGTGLTVNDGKSLHLYNSSGLAPIYAGTLTLNGTSAPTSLFADGSDVGFARRIKIILAGSGNNYFQGSGKFILEAYSFLEGRGYIQSNFDNRGTITGETLEFGAIALNNSGSMSGSYHLNGTEITNSGTMSDYLFHRRAPRLTTAAA
jgi:hypothetical protein